MSDTELMSRWNGLGFYDKLFLGGSLLSLICTFFAFDGINEGHLRRNEDAWHRLGVLASVLILLVLVLAVIDVVVPDVLGEPPVSLNLIEAGGMAVAAVFFLLRWATLGSTLVFKIHLRWGGYVTLIVTIVTAVIGFIRMRDAGEALPWEKTGEAA